MAHERWVVNASPVIALSAIGQEGILFELADEVVIPLAVALEIEAGPKDDPAQQQIKKGRFSVVETPSPPAEILAWDLGAGETAVLSMARLTEGWVAILDDAAARKCAQSFNIQVKGTLAIILLAKQKGIINSAAVELRTLQSIGFRLDERIIREALQQTVGETW